MDYNQVANAIVGHCGGLANFLHVTNCMTRVRMTISDQTRVNIAALKSIEGVLGVVEDDTLQVIVGPGKSSKVANVINDLLKGQPADATPLSNVEQKLSWRGKRRKNRPAPKLSLSILPIFLCRSCHR